MGSIDQVISSRDRAETSQTELKGESLAGFKRLIHTIFGSLLLLVSLFLALCYITFNLYDALNSPFFGWLRRGAAAAQAIYFPVFFLAVLALPGNRKSRGQRLAGLVLLVQVIGGLLLYLYTPTTTSSLGRVLIFGPNLHQPAGGISTYSEALACLLPVIWISAIRLAANLKRTEERMPPLPSFASFLLVGFVAGLGYAGVAGLRLAAGGPFLGWTAVAFSLAAHIGILAALYLLLHWLRVLSLRLSNPWRAEFAMRNLVLWLLLAVLLRKIVMALLGFNNGLADFYSAAFALAIVIFAASLRLRPAREPGAQTGAVPVGGTGSRHGLLRQLPGRAIKVIASGLLFYIFAVRFPSLDWEHVVGSVTALLAWFLFFSGSKRVGHGDLRLVTLAAATFALAGVGVGLVFAAKTDRLSSALEQYSNYDQSFFAIQQAVRPVVHDDKYATLYKFLRNHSNLRIPVQTPDARLAPALKPAAAAKPDIYILVVDGLRQDYVSAYNPEVTFTPAMGAFAKDSVVFRNAYSPYAGTALAAAAIWSGTQQISRIFPSPLARFNQLQEMLDVDGYQCLISYNPVIEMLTNGGGARPACTDVTVNLPMMQQQEFGHIATALQEQLGQRRPGDPPVFVYSQPANVHTLALVWGGAHIDVTHYPGFNDAYASATAVFDARFGQFVELLKARGLYENSIIIVTSDHGESLGEVGRGSHVSSLAPEVIRVPLIIHLPETMRSRLYTDPQRFATIQDITPTLYYLLGHNLAAPHRWLGRPLFARSQSELEAYPVPRHYFFMSSYLPVFGILSTDQKRLFYVDATVQRSYYYDLARDPRALYNRIDEPTREHYVPLLKDYLERIDRFYNVDPSQLGP